MELPEICEKAKAEHGLSQNELASKIGMTKENLSSALRHRRKLPAEAAIELSELTGMRAKEVWQAAKRWAQQGGMHAALAVLSFVVLYLTGDEKSAFLSMGWMAGTLQLTNYRDLGEERRSSAKKHVTRSPLSPRCYVVSMKSRRAFASPRRRSRLSMALGAVTIRHSSRLASRSCEQPFFRRR